MNFTLAADRFGENTVAFRAIDSLGHRYLGEVLVQVLPEIRIYDLPAQIVAANSGLHILNLLSALGFSETKSLSPIEIVAATNPSLFRKLQIENISLIYEPFDKVIGHSVVEVASMDPDGRPFTARIDIIVDTWKHWLSVAFTPQVLADPALEATVWGEKADADLDGWDNLTEYVFGGNPLLREPKDSWITTDISIQSDRSVRHLISLSTRTNDEKLVIQIEVSSDQLNWQSQSLADGPHLKLLSQSPIGSNFILHTLLETQPLQNTSPRFMRVSVQRIP